MRLVLQARVRESIREQEIAPCQAGQGSGRWLVARFAEGHRIQYKRAECCLVGLPGRGLERRGQQRIPHVGIGVVRTGFECQCRARGDPGDLRKRESRFHALVRQVGRVARKAGAMQEKVPDRDPRVLPRDEDADRAVQVQSLRLMQFQYRERGERFRQRGDAIPGVGRIGDPPAFIGHANRPGEHDLATMRHHDRAAKGVLPGIEVDHARQSCRETLRLRTVLCMGRS